MPASRPRQGQPRRRADRGDEAGAPAEAEEAGMEAEAGAGAEARPAMSQAEQAALRRKLREKFH
jgi:hypothetical protein